MAVDLKAERTNVFELTIPGEEQFTPIFIAENEISSEQWIKVFKILNEFNPKNFAARPEGDSYTWCACINNIHTIAPERLKDVRPTKEMKKFLASPYKTDSTWAAVDLFLALRNLNPEKADEIGMVQEAQERTKIEALRQNGSFSTMVKDLAVYKTAGWLSDVSLKAEEVTWLKKYLEIQDNPLWFLLTASAARVVAPEEFATLPITAEKWDWLKSGARELMVENLNIAQVNDFVGFMADAAIVAAKNVRITKFGVEISPRTPESQWTPEVPMPTERSF